MKIGTPERPDPSARSLEGGLTFSLEFAAKTFALGLGSMYVLGLAVLNTYLLNLGTAEFALLRVQYIATGGLVVLPLFLSMISILVAFGMYSDSYFLDFWRDIEKSRVAPLFQVVPKRMARIGNPIIFGSVPLGVFLSPA